MNEIFYKFPKESDIWLVSNPATVTKKFNSLYSDFIKQIQQGTGKKPQNYAIYS